MEDLETKAVLAEEDDDYDVDLSDIEVEEDEEEQDGNQTDEESSSEATEDEKKEPSAEESAGTSEEKPDTDTFELKYNKEIRRVNRDEITELAQKGLNHDRILAQRDELQRENGELQKFRQENESNLNLLNSAAELAGMSVSQFLNNIRENALVAKGMSRDAAKERVLREDAEQKLARKSAEDAAKAESEKREKTSQERIKRDSEEFARKYKDVDPKTIPQEVWEAVSSGESLVTAYGNYLAEQTAKENEKLRAEIEALKKNEENRSKSIGSMKTEGQQKGKDPFLEGLFGDD